MNCCNLGNCIIRWLEKMSFYTERSVFSTFRRRIKLKESCIQIWYCYRDILVHAEVSLRMSTRACAGASPAGVFYLSREKVVSCLREFLISRSPSTAQSCTHRQIRRHTTTFDLLDLAESYFLQKTPHCPTSTAQTSAMLPR